MLRPQLLGSALTSDSNLLNRCLLLCLFLSLLFPTSVRASVTMSIDDVKFENGAKVEFRKSDSQTENVDSARLSQMQVTETEEHKFSIYADLDSISPATAGGFARYVFYLRRANAAESDPLVRFNFQAIPYGSFLDRRVELQFHVSDSSGATDVGRLQVPVHSFVPGEILSIAKDSEVPVRVSGDTLELVVENHLPDLPVAIVGAEIGPREKAHWKNLPVPHTQVSPEHPLQLSVHGSRTLGWRLDPSPWKALSDSLIPLSKGAPDDTLTITLIAASAMGGFQQPTEVSRRVRFYPSGWGLAVAAGLGALAATLVVFFGVKRDAGFWRFLGTVGINVVLAWIVELIGILLWTYSDTKFVLFGIDLNPALLLPAAFVGIVTGIYGFKVVGKILA